MTGEEEGHQAARESEPEWRTRVEELFLAHNRNLVGFLMPRLQSEQTARDIAQEAYVRLLQLEKPDSTNFLRAYLYKIASNLAIDHIRKKGRDRAYIAQSALPELSIAATQERSISAKQELAMVRAAIGELPIKCRKAFLLARVHGWSSRRIGGHLEVTDRMVRLYIVRALEHIQLKISSAAQCDVYDEEINDGR